MHLIIIYSYSRWSGMSATSENFNVWAKTTKKLNIVPDENHTDKDSILQARLSPLQ